MLRAKVPNLLIVNLSRSYHPQWLGSFRWAFDCENSVKRSFIGTRAMLYSVCVRAPPRRSQPIPAGSAEEAATTFGGVPSHSTSVQQSLLFASTIEFARVRSA